MYSPTGSSRKRGLVEGYGRLHGSERRLDVIGGVGACRWICTSKSAFYVITPKTVYQRLEHFHKFFPERFDRPNNLHDAGRA